MSDAKKCDRCGRFYEQNSTPFDKYGDTSNISGEKIIATGITLCSTHMGQCKYFDLCDECLESFDRWMRCLEKDGAKKSTIDIRKSCSNCKFKSLMKRDDPCVYCGYYDRWEPGKMTKGENGNKTESETQDIGRIVMCMNCKNHDSPWCDDCLAGSRFTKIDE